MSSLERLNKDDASLCKKVEFKDAEVPSELDKYWPKLLSENAWKDAWGLCRVCSSSNLIIDEGKCLPISNTVSQKVYFDKAIQLRQTFDFMVQKRISFSNNYRKCWKKN